MRRFLAQLPLERRVRHGGTMNTRIEVRGDPKFISLWNQICQEREDEERLWIADLRSKGFKAAHPNDGWVNRETNEVFFSYPQFNDGADIGDLVMLGWPWKNGNHRPIRLTGKSVSVLGNMTYWTFEDVDSTPHKEHGLFERIRAMARSFLMPNGGVQAPCAASCARSPGTKC